MVLGLAASLNLEIEQMDVKMIFLYNDQEKEIYMEQPKGFNVNGKKNCVQTQKESLWPKQAFRQ